MACKAYRDYGKEVNGVTRAEIVAPSTVHSAFDKAAQYLGMRLKSIKVDSQNYQVDIKAFKKAITSNTVMVSKLLTLHHVFLSQTFYCLT